MKYRRRVVLAAVVVVVVAAVLARHQRRARAPATAVHSVSAGSAFAAPPRADVAGRRVAGAVLLDERPAAGALVRIDDAAPVRTDATGHFDLGVQRIARHLVVAESPHSTGAVVDLQLDDPAIDSEHLTLTVHACTASLHGTIRDAAGGTIAHARIAMSDDDDRPGAGVDSADDGSYELCLGEQVHHVIVSADGYAHTKVPVVAAAGRARRDFSLVPEVPVVGHVVRAQDQSPVAGADVELHVERPGEPEVLVLRTTSDGDGRFHISGAPPGRHSVMASAAPLATSNGVPVLAELGAPPEDIVVEVVAVASVRGKVISAGKPVSGAWVALSVGTQLWDLSAHSHPDGSFEIDRVQPGHYGLSVTGYTVAQKTTIDVASADVTGLVLDVSPKASVAGRVTHAGKPIEGASVQTDDGATTTDSEGRFTIRDMEPGEHRIYAESKRLGVFTHGPAVTLGEGEQRTGLEIEMELSGSIAGTVVDQNGAPVSGVIVAFSLLHGTDYGQAATGEDGSFTATALSGGGSYVYQVRPLDSPSTFPLADGRRFAPIAVADGQSHVTGVRIRIVRERKVIAGRVTTTAGAPVADAVVRAELRDRFIRTLPSATTDVTGAFRIEDVPPGTYRVTAMTPHAEQSVDKVAAGRTDLAIQLAESATIDGTLEGFTSPPAVYAFRTDGVQWFQATVHGTSFSLRAVPPGEYTIDAIGVKDTVTVAPGGHASVVLRKRPSGSIVGTFVDDKHAPIEDGMCGCAAGTNATTDAEGHFHFDDVPPGTQFVSCQGAGTFATGEVAVLEGQPASIALTARSTTRPSRSGMRLERQFEDLVVAAVDPGGPAERAGIQVGDVLVNEDGTPYAGGLESRAPGTVVQLTLERGDKRLTVSLTLAPR